MKLRFPRSLAIAVVSLPLLTPVAAAQCLFDNSGSNPWVSLRDVVDNCPDPQIRVTGTGLGLCAVTLRGGIAVNASNKQVRIVANASGTIPRVCFVPENPGEAAFRVVNATNFDFRGYGAFNGAGQPALHIDGGNVRIAGMSPTRPVGATGPGSDGIRVDNGAVATLTYAHVDQSAVALRLTGSTVSIRRIAVAENLQIGIVSSNARVTIDEASRQPSIFNSNDDGFIVRDQASLMVRNSIFHHNLAPFDRAGDHLVLADDSARVALFNVNAHANGDNTRYDRGVTARGASVAIILANTFADNRWGVSLELGSSAARLAVYDSIFANNGGIAVNCIASVIGSNNDFWSPAWLPSCIGPQSSFDPQFTTAGLPASWVGNFTNHRVYLIDSANMASVQDAGLIGASYLFNNNDRTVFDPGVADVSTTTNDLGYHNHCNGGC